MRFLEPIQLNGHCYVLHRGNWIHPITHRRHELLWYPEIAMSLFKQYAYRPYVQSIVTENPWLITLYDREKVRIVYEDGSWQLPQYQTYGAGRKQYEQDNRNNYRPAGNGRFHQVQRHTMPLRCHRDGYASREDAEN